MLKARDTWIVVCEPRLANSTYDMVNKHMQKNQFVYQHVSTVMKRITLALIFSIFFGTQVHAWVETAGFENGTIGQQAIGPDAFDNGGYTNTTFDNQVVRNGTVSAKMTAIQGSTDWGAFNRFPSTLGEGDEIWMRYYLYFPPGFNFSCSQCAGLKTMRIHTRSASGANEGYFDVLIGAGVGLNVASEVANTDFYNNWPNGSWAGLGSPVPTGQWHAIEQYVKFSSVPGQGIYRVWQNGNLIFEDTQTYTLRSSTSVADYNFIFGYWNGNAPATQSAYIDDFVVSSDTPSNFDSHGNRFIGLSTSTFVARPKPPVIVSIK